MFNLKLKTNNKKNENLLRKFSFLPTTNYPLPTKSGFTPTPMNIGVSSQSERGFTLIEMLVAITILLISITGPLVLAQQGIKSSRLAKNQMIASFLAQDAVEYIRNVRDSNNLANGFWLNSLYSCIILSGCEERGNSGKVVCDNRNPKGKCKIDTVNGSIQGCSGDYCPFLKKDENTGLYGYQNPAWVDTNFVRGVSIELGQGELGNEAEEILVEVSIFWDFINGIPGKSFVVREKLFKF